MAGQRHGAVAGRMAVARAALALLIVALAWVGAVGAARVLLRGVVWQCAFGACPGQTRLLVAATPTPPPPTAFPASAIVVGLGATQSYGGLAITVGDLRATATSGFVAAPRGAMLVIVTVRLVNTTPGATVAYNAYDFALIAAGGALQHETLAALPAPLGVGVLPPEGQAAGQVAFVEPLPATPYQPAAQIVYLPSAAAGPPLAWSVSLPPVGA